MLAQDPDSQLVMTPRRGRRRLRAGERRAARRPRSGRGWTRRWPPWASRTAGTGRPRRSPAGRSSAWSWPGRSPGGPACCCSTSPPPSSTRAGAALVRAAVARVVGRPRATTARRRPRRRPVAAAGGPGGRGDPGGLVEHGRDWRPASRAAGLDLPAASTGRSCSPRRPPASPTAGAPTPALPPTTALLRAGRALAVTGPNGTGKSTLALLLAGLRAPSTGRVRAAAELAAGVRRGDPQPHRWRAGELVSRIGTVFQHPEQQFLTGRLRDELALGPLALRRARHGRPRHRRGAARAARADRVRRRQPVHALRRSAAPAVGRHRAGHRAPGARARRADVRPGRGHLAGAGHAAGRAAGRAAARSPWSPTTPTWWTSSPTTGCQL